MLIEIRCIFLLLLMPHEFFRLLSEGAFITLSMTEQNCYKRKLQFQLQPGHRLNAQNLHRCSWIMGLKNKTKQNKKRGF